MKYLIYCLLATSLLACKQKDCSGELEKKLMGVWYKKKLVNGEGWRLLNREYISAKDSIDVNQPNVPFFILHYFTADCDKCINDLLAAQKFIEKNRDQFPRIKYVFVASGPTDLYIKEAIQKSKFEFPVYYEQKFLSFKRANNFPLQDELNNTILVNRQREILLFGGFYNNTKAQDILASITNCE